jgi:hypothetical protein
MKTTTTMSNNNNTNNNKEDELQKSSSSSSKNRKRSRMDRIKSKLQITPKHVSVMYMSLCMAVHFSGHEFARAPITSLFTSEEVGFENSAILPLAVGVVCPFSILVLCVFKKVLQSQGPLQALIQSTLVYSALLLFVALALRCLTTSASIPAAIGGEIGGSGSGNIKAVKEAIHLTVAGFGIDIQPHALTKSLLFVIFVFQSANVQFLYTQHWSFLGSILTPEEGKVWFAPIAGIGSITSTFAAANVAHLVETIGLVGLLACAALVIGSSAFFADMAYSVARKVRSDVELISILQHYV